MPTCIEYMRQRLETNGYRIKHQTAHDLIVAELYPTVERPVWVFHVAAPITPEDIRRCFDFKGHLMFIVDEKLIPDDVAVKEHTPMWLRVLHGLYLGRIYVWNGRGVYGVHFDYDTGDVSECPYIPVEDLRCQENNSWVKGWSAMYRLAFLHDRAWWKESPPRHRWAGDSGYQSAGYQEYSYSTSGSSSANTNGWKYDPDSGFAYHEKEWPGGKPPKAPPPPAKTDYYSQFLGCRNAAEAKALWKRLLIEHHPDKLGVDADAAAIEKATKITQEINQAYQKAERVL